MPRCSFALGVIASILLLAGCTSTSAPTGPRPAAADDPAASTKLVKGMTRDAVRTLLGKPAEVSMTLTAEGIAETWTYRRTYRLTQPDATSTELIPAFVGPGRGDNGLGTVEVPAYSMAFYEIHETIKLLMFKDQLLEWKRTATQQRRYNY